MVLQWMPHRTGICTWRIVRKGLVRERRIRRAMCRGRSGSSSRCGTWSAGTRQRWRRPRTHCQGRRWHGATTVAGRRRRSRRCSCTCRMSIHGRDLLMRRYGRCRRRMCIHRGRRRHIRAARYKYRCFGKLGSNRRRRARLERNGRQRRVRA